MKESPYLLQFTQGTVSLSLSDPQLVVSPKLLGRINWHSWKTDIFDTLDMQHGVFVAILRGEVESPVPPTFLPTDPTTVFPRSVEDRMTVGRASHFAERDHQGRPALKELIDKFQEINTENQRRKQLYDTENFFWTFASTSLRSFLSSCCDETTKGLVQNINSPHLAFKTLEAEYSSPSCIIQRWKYFSEMRHRGSDAPGFIQLFLGAKWAVEQEIGALSPLVESSVFIVAVSDNPWCEAFVQNSNPVTDVASLRNMYCDFQLNQ